LNRKQAVFMVSALILTGLAFGYLLSLAMKL